MKDSRSGYSEVVRGAVDMDVFGGIVTILMFRSQKEAVRAVDIIITIGATTKIRQIDAELCREVVHDAPLRPRVVCSPGLPPRRAQPAAGYFCVVGGGGRCSVVGCVRVRVWVRVRVRVRAGGRVRVGVGVRVC